jgi:hypothetical protein
MAKRKHHPDKGGDGKMFTMINAFSELFQDKMTTSNFLQMSPKPLNTHKTQSIGDLERTLQSYEPSFDAERFYRHELTLRINRHEQSQGLQEKERMTTLYHHTKIRPHRIAEMPNKTKRERQEEEHHESVKLRKLCRIKRQKLIAKLCQK